MSGRRYAIYFAPESGTALDRFGRAWLGRDPDTASPGALPDLGWPAEFHARIVAAPRLYGLHATLKAPIALADGLERAGLVEALRAFAARRPPVLAAPPTLSEIDGFLALVPRQSEPAIAELAAACVESFDRFRAPPGDAERAKRLAHPLSPRQIELLERWGYPYVMEQFRFHVTLTDRLAEPDRPMVRRMLEPRLAETAHEPLRIASLCLFEQPAPGQWFVLTERFPLAAPGPRI